ncbi:DsbE family thiol:disulfide interchange protein [Massilia sp. NR 4-1]|uniref:DsbE family thiol:disulfide interchange protein n=1 Tax=Massilia sp. NR 4-1 TaxID=1678028 RepID=UPI00067AAF0B|nr:DsbE family thiol:disulfide interchange protein [Massilia sp. NR 4-1]AKU21031.1 thiol:disulfide interchange protein [Massilia sp. NR 4-1]
MKRFLLPLAVFSVLLLFLGAGLNLNPRELPSPLVGKPTPPFSAVRLDDAAGRISPSDMAGRAWLLNVWASWCASCRIEHPLLMQFAQRQGTPLVGLNYKDGQEDARQWLAQHGNPYQQSAFDPEGRLGMDFGVYGVPETFVIDKRGVIRLRHAGPLSEEVLQRKILPLLKELENG